MTQAERIRKYYREHPAASYDEVAEVVGTTNSNVRANLAKDIKAGRCVRLNEIARMNQNHLFTSNADLTKTGIGLTKLTNKIREVEKNG